MYAAPLLFNGAVQAIGAFLGAVRSAPSIECRVTCPEPSPVDGQLLGILREQLQRCGLAELNIRECPACVCQAAAAGGAAQAVACFAAGLVVGGVAVAALSRCSRRSRGEEEVSVQGGLQPVVRAAVVAPSSLRALR